MALLCFQLEDFERLYWLFSAESAYNIKWYVTVQYC